MPPPRPPPLQPPQPNARSYSLGRAADPGPKNLWVSRSSCIGARRSCNGAAGGLRCHSWLVVSVASTGTCMVRYVVVVVVSLGVGREKLASEPDHCLRDSKIINDKGIPFRRSYCVNPVRSRSAEDNSSIQGHNMLRLLTIPHSTTD